MIHVDWRDSNMQDILNEMVIYEIQRELIEQQNKYKWTIQITSPSSGDEITFTASGFTQILREEPVLSEFMSLPSSKRLKLLG